MTSFDPNDYRVKKANSAYEDRDLSGYATDAEKIEYLQDENRLLRSLIVEYQKEFLPEALSEYPMFQSKDEVPLDLPFEDEGKDKGKKPRRSLKKKAKRSQRSIKQLIFDALIGCKGLGKIKTYCSICGVSRAGFYRHLKFPKVDKDADIANSVIDLQIEMGFRVGILKTQALLAKKGIAVGHNKLARIMSEYSLNPIIQKKASSTGLRTEESIPRDGANGEGEKTPVSN